MAFGREKNYKFYPTIVDCSVIFKDFFDAPLLKICKSRKNVLDYFLKTPHELHSDIASFKNCEVL